MVFIVLQHLCQCRAAGEKILVAGVQLFGQVVETSVLVGPWSGSSAEHAWDAWASGAAFHCG